MNELQLKLCDIQGRLFELSAEKRYNSAAFVKAFMTSNTAKELDSKYRPRSAIASKSRVIPAFVTLPFII